MKLKVCIAGATGWVGKPLCMAVSAAGDPSLVGAVSRTQKGRRLRDVLGGSNIDLTVSGGVLLFLLALPMLFGQRSSLQSPEGGERSAAGEDVAIFPMAVPMTVKTLRGARRRRNRATSRTG